MVRKRADAGGGHCTVARAQAHHAPLVRARAFNFERLVRREDVTEGKSGLRRCESFLHALLQECAHYFRRRTAAVASLGFRLERYMKWTWACSSVQTVCGWAARSGGAIGRRSGASRRSGCTLDRARRHGTCHDVYRFVCDAGSRTREWEAPNFSESSSALSATGDTAWNPTLLWPKDGPVPPGTCLRVLAMELCVLSRHSEIPWASECAKLVEAHCCCPVQPSTPQLSATPGSNNPRHGLFIWTGHF